MSTKMGLLKRLRLGMKLMGNMTDEEASILAKVVPGGYKTSPFRGAAGMLAAYSKSPWLRAVVGKLADAVGSTKWMLYSVTNPSGKHVKMPDLQARGVKPGNLDLPEGYDLVPVLDHPFLRLLNTANPMFPGSVGRAQTQIQLELTGEAHWILDPEFVGDRAVPERFWLIPSPWVRSMPSTASPYWDIKTPSWEGQLPPPAVFRFVTPDPVNPYSRGSGHMRAFGDEIDTDQYAAEYTKNWFLNSARPDLLITANDLDREDTKRMELSWLQSLQSFRKAHKPFFLPKKVDVHQLSPKFSEMEMRPLRSWERDVIVHGVGMPPEVLGIIENSNRATIEAADYMMAKYVTTPRLELQRTFMQYLLLPIYDDRLVLGYESPIQEDREYQLSVMKSNPPAYTVNDWKRQAGLEPVDDGDVYLLPFNLKVVETLTPTADPLEGKRKSLSNGDAVMPLPATCGHDHGGAAALRRHVGPTTAPRHIPRDKQVGGEHAVDLALELSAQMQKDVIAAFVELQNSLDINALMIAFEAGDIEAAMALITEADVAASLESARQTLREAVVLAGEGAAAELSTYLSESIAFSLTNPEAVAFLEEFGAEFVTNVTPTTRDAIRLALKDAYERGLTPAEAAKEVRKSIGLTEAMMEQKANLIRDMLEAGASQAEIETFIGKWTEQKIRERALLIAENELVEAGNAGQEMLWDQAAGEGYIDPATATRTWVTTQDDKTCTLCQPMDGMETGLYEPWQTGSGPVNTPNQIHIRCRCTEVLNVRR